MLFNPGHTKRVHKCWLDTLNLGAAGARACNVAANSCSSLYTTEQIDTLIDVKFLPDVEKII